MLNPNINSIKLSSEEYIRYTKHLILENVGIQGQKRLKRAKILTIGAGGLGCPAMLYLVTSGIGYLGIIDNDTIDFSNLNRQILYSPNDIKQQKAILAKNKLKTINSKCKIITHLYYLNFFNASEIIQYYDIIIDTSDNFKTRYIIDKICHNLNKIYIYGAIHEFEGQVCTFNYKDGIRYKDIYSQKFNIKNWDCNNSGIVGVTAGHIGILQATQAIKIILGITEVLSNNLLISNLISMNTKKIKIYTKSKTKSIIQVNQLISKTTLNDLKLKTSNKFIILDIRKRAEFYKKHIKNSINIPLIHFKASQALKFIAKYGYKKIVIIYCNTINRSIIASNILSCHQIRHYILTNK
uniref:Molybdopterin biosynthesis protein n=1 Tax=Bostrychia tenella TaxID=324755 RepID=A0A1Z1M5I0_9FLOR|nr:Molybdopterin biosynthesis protein [Bostrychia tenella]ARW61328.1 Molybdopterin biosynthesis protein [Bostrychia tenella]